MEPKIPDSPLPTDTDRACYTVNEFITRVFPMSRVTFYEAVRAGTIKTFKRGHRRYVPADEGRNLVARLQAESASEAA